MQINALNLEGQELCFGTTVISAQCEAAHALGKGETGNSANRTLLRIYESLPPPHPTMHLTLIHDAFNSKVLISLESEGIIYCLYIKK